MQTWRRAPVWLFGGFWALGIVLFTFRYLTNPHNPMLTGGEQYGTTYPGELSLILSVTAAEVLVSCAIVRPWSYQRSWLRALLCATVFAPWLALWAALGLHHGPTTHAHTTWLVLFWIGLLAAAVVSAAAAFRARSHSSPAAP